MSTSLSIPDLIIKKRDGRELTQTEIETFVKLVVDEKVQDSQIGAMLMAMYTKDLSIPEITHLTRSMMNSGDTLTWPKEWKGILVDKHSTGGVGDKVSLILAPALAACGLKVPMVSGRGLEHTGGTLDKLESIPGFKVSVTTEEMKKILETVGCCIVGPTSRLCPADGIFYKTRDVTGTVDHIGLITASIISKKAAENLDALVLDVKFGTGAVKKDFNDAKRLAQLMVASSKDLGTKTVSLLTDMNSPLGLMIGNSLEVAESITCLHGNGPADLVGLVCQLGGHLLSLVGKANSPEDGTRQINETLQDGSALKKFCAMMEAQGVTSSIAEDLCRSDADVMKILPAAQTIEPIASKETGYVIGIDALKCGKVAHRLGSGRTKVGEELDHSIGLELLAKIGDQVEKGSPWIKVYSKKGISEDLRMDLEGALTISKDPPKDNRVREVIS